MKKLLILALISAALSACVGQPIVMQNQHTKEIAQCNSNGVSDLIRDWQNEQCAKAYEKGGWVRLNPEKDTP